MSDAMITMRTKRMGCPFSITVVRPPGASRATIERVIGLAFNEVARIEDLLTDFRESPLTAMNRTAGQAACVVPDELFRLLDYALSVSRDCDGAFDITYAAVGHLWRRAFQTGLSPAADDLARARASVGYRGVVLDPANRSVRFRLPGMKIGLGGVGKGYGVDAAFRFLSEMGYENFMVNGAGDIRVSTARDAPRPWRIGIKNPFAPDDSGAGLLTLARGAVATSGDYERFMVVGGKRYHHIIDARSGEIREDLRSVTIQAPTALQADVYATTAMSLGIPDALAFLSRHRGIRAVVITREGQVHTSGFSEGCLRSVPSAQERTTL